MLRLFLFYSQYSFQMLDSDIVDNMVAEIEKQKAEEAEKKQQRKKT